MERMKPILFNTEMVRAILDGRKTVTRRVIKAGAHKILRGGTFPGAVDWSLKVAAELDNHGMVIAPYQPGDTLYVRETFAQPYGKGFFYAADYQDEDIVPADCGDVSVSKNLIKWHPSIHMPKEVARIFLRVTSVRVERLQECGNGWCLDIEKEGIKTEKNPILYISDEEYHSALRAGMKHVWDSTIKPADRDRCGWDANPWCWVIQFDRCEKPKGE